MGDKLLELFPAEAPLFSFLTSAVFITCISERLFKEVRTPLIYQWHQVFGILSITGWLQRGKVHPCSVLGTIHSVRAFFSLHGSFHPPPHTPSHISNASTTVRNV